MKKTKAIATLFALSWMLGLCIFANSSQPEFTNSFSFEYCPGVCPGTQDMSIAWEQETDLSREALFYNKDYHRFLVRDAEGNPVGVLAMYKCCITQFAVLKKFQRRGIGTRLFFKAIDHMAKNGCQEARWLALSSSVGFYEKMGAECLHDDGYMVRMSIALKK